MPNRTRRLTSGHRHALRVNPLADALALAAYILWAGLDLAAEKTAAWWADLTRPEKRATLVQLAINLGLVAALIVALTACEPRDTQPGPIEATAVDTSAAKVVQP
jgi:hypothetical protein